MTNQADRKIYIESNPCFNINNGLCYPDFFKLVKQLQEQLVRPLCIVELGTRKWGTPSTHHKNDFYVNGIDISNYIMTDYLEGEDVDKIVDLHKFTEVFKPESVDVVFSGSTFEHIKYPWLAAHELMLSLKTGGYIHICTHQSFPLHGYPYDYYRFSRNALESLFPTEMNMKNINSWYDFLVDIVPDDISVFRNKLSESYLNVNLITTKTGPTPSKWIYRFDK